MRENSEVIRSSQNKYVSLARGLSNKKIREENHLFRFDGIKLMCEALRNGVELDTLFIRDGAESAVFEKAELLYGIMKSEIKCRIVTVSGEIFDKLTEEMAPEGVICIAKYIDRLHSVVDTTAKIFSDSDEKILLLESVRDPQNVGAIIRVAAAFSVDRIIMSRDCADIYNPKTLRASMGTVFGMKIDRVADMKDAVECLRREGRRVFAAALDRNSQRLGGFDVLAGDCIVIGNEGHGLSAETVNACDQTVFIPMAAGVESLNAATAAAVLVWEFFGSGLN